MKVILFGATGMVGSGVLLECLDDPAVESVVAVSRSPSRVRHPKLTEVIHDDFFDYSGLEGQLTGFDACFFCLGVSAAGMSEERYHRITHDLTLGAAEALLEWNPGLTFCYLSGSGADSSEKGRIMWARIKGKIENRLLEMPFEAVYLFRPAYIQPLKGITSRTRLYRVLYAVLGPFYPVLKRLFPKHVTTTEKVGRAMIDAARNGYATPIIENHDINALASRAAPG